MPDKQKVTLYLSDELHRQFKIRSAVDGETMSSMAQRALEFYLSHAEIVEKSAEGYGRTHLVHSCPQCAAAVTLKDNSLSLVRGHGSCSQSRLTMLEGISQLTQQSSQEVAAEGIAEGSTGEASKNPGEGELITC